VTDAYVTKVDSEVAADADADVRATLVNAEVASNSDGTVQARITAQFTEVAAVSDGTVQARFTLLFVEVLTSIPAIPVAPDVGTLALTGYAPRLTGLSTPGSDVIPQLYVHV